MSDDYKVPYTVIKEVKPHAGADRLEVAMVYGWQVVVQKGRYQVGSPIIYIPIDSVLNQELEDRIFGKDAKIKLHNHRVRQIKIRGLASQGMVIDPEDVKDLINLDYATLEQDLAEILDIKKYEPPARGPSFTVGKDKQRNKKTDNPLFHKYNGLNNIRWLPDYFSEGEQVVIQEKLHGSNGRISVLPYHADTYWKKIKKFLKIAPKFVRCYGSNNVDISSTTDYKGYYGEDVFGKCFDSLKMFERINPGEIFYGEIIGPGIQKNYNYSVTSHRFVVFDAKILMADGKFKWLEPEAVEKICSERGFEYVPVLYKGPYNKEFSYQLTKGASAYDPNTKVREGIVIKGREVYSIEGNKRALKWVSEDYLSQDNTDFH